MNYCNIKKIDIANGIGVRVTLFVSGCRRHCKGCFQPETWDFNYGKEFTQDTEDEILKLLAPDYVDGLTVMGGEPFEPENQVTVYWFLKRVRDKYPNKTIWVYSGYTYEELTDTERLPKCENLLSLIDVLVDGPFIEEKKNLTLPFRGSENQRIIEMKRG